MKVCFISHSSGKAGAERSLIETLDALKEQGVESCVLLPQHGVLGSELSKRNIPFYVIPYKWWMSGKNSPLWKRLGRTILNLFTTVPIAKKIKQWQCDIVYTNTITVCAGALAAALIRRPHIWHIREFGYEDHGLVFDLGQKFSLWLMDKLTSIFIVNSNAVAQKYKQYIIPSKLKVIYQSVNVPQHILTQKATLPAQASPGISCAIVGNLQEGKKQEDAIRAFSELVHMGIRAELSIIGRGDREYRKYLHGLVSKNKLDEHVKFVGYVENPFPFMESTDVMLICSRCEVFGRVTVEAMKLGKPVVGARSGGTTELIRDGFNGLLYTPGDYKELAGKIRYLYEHPDVARQMGENGLRWATEQFSQEHYGKEILTTLEQFTGHKS